jgi:hypothetical protein
MYKSGKDREIWKLWLKAPPKYNAREIYGLA